MDDFCKRHNKVVMMMGHFGNWELVSGICGENDTRSSDNFANFGIMLGYKKIRNKIADNLFCRMRMNLYKKFKTEGGIVESHKILRHILKDRNARNVYVFIADQSPHDGARVVTQFLGRPTLMMPGPEYIATKLDVPVIYMGMKRVKRGEYMIKYTIISEHSSSEPEYFITREYARLLEEDIKGCKYNWLWSHKRWKKQFTPQEKEEYAKLVRNLE
jgi:Lauroyl/myristoyl acyltransferase